MGGPQKEGAAWLKSRMAILCRALLDSLLLSNCFIFFFSFFSYSDITIYKNILNSVQEFPGWQVQSDLICSWVRMVIAIFHDLPGQSLGLEISQALPLLKIRPLESTELTDLAVFPDTGVAQPAGSCWILPDAGSCSHRFA